MKATEVSRLETALRADGDLKLVPYVMGGHPNPKKSLEVARRLAASGVAAIEIGVAHSDPLADGPVIQKAGQAALAAGMTVGACLELAGAVATEGVPVILMSYINPILAYDPRRFAAAAAQAGVAGVIVPDMPIEEAEPVAGWFRAAALDTVFMVAPTTAPARMEAICQRSAGFVYCVTLTGITGARGELSPALAGLAERARAATDVPLYAGFGISTPGHAHTVGELADGIVVGSRACEVAEQGPDALRDYVASLRAGLDSAVPA